MSARTSHERCAGSRQRRALQHRAGFGEVADAHGALTPRIRSLPPASGSCARRVARVASADGPASRFVKLRARHASSSPASGRQYRQAHARSPMACHGYRRTHQSIVSRQSRQRSILARKSATRTDCAAGSAGPVTPKRCLRARVRAFHRRRSRPAEGTARGGGITAANQAS